MIEIKFFEFLKIKSMIVKYVKSKEKLCIFKINILKK